MDQGCQTHFHRRPGQPPGCLQRADVILGLYKCNYSRTRGKELSAASGEKQGAGWIKQGGGGQPACGPVFAPCGLDQQCFFFSLRVVFYH